jgi:endonuclease G, mitochondrial
MFATKYFYRIVLLSTLVLLACSKPNTVSPSNFADNGNMLLGNPSQAAASKPNNYLVDKGYYILSYNNSTRIANWVSWHLDANAIGTADRQDDFRPDASLPSGWYKVDDSSYSGSGFDRGHNCPSADRTSSVAANSATFLMTNMIPQAPNNNRQTWANLEDYARTLVSAGNEVYIVMGTYGSGGTGSNGYATTIDQGRIVVPAYIWKVLVVIPQGNNDLARINSSTRVIAVNTPNSQSVSSNWRNYRTSVNAIEQATGYDILSNLSESLQTVLEVKIDAN